MNTGRRGFIAAGSAALGTLALPRRARAAGPFRIIITETQIPLVPNSVTWLALSLGYFKRAGVDVQLVEVGQTPSAVAALRSGGGEMANISTDTALQLIGRNQMVLRGVVSPDRALPFVIAAKKTIGKIADLAGKTFGVARVGSVDYEMTRVVLAKLGVNPDSVQYLAIGQPDVRAQSLLAGQIDATTFSIGIFTTLPDKSSIKVLVSQADYFKNAPFVSKLNVVTADVAKSRPEDVAAVVRGYIAASRDFAAHPKIWVDAVAAARPDVTRAELTALAESYAHSWSVNGGLNLNTVKFTTDTLYQGPDFKDLRPVPPSEWIDLSYIKNALRTVGVDRADDPTA
ncbi:MAG: ABC transporter substrate-binding protein [Candidatus Lustribacter sp.]|jgi:NitT/TauT family transport system substrate-binding protein